MKKYYTIILILIGASTISGQTNLETYLESADNFFRKGEYENAVSNYLLAYDKANIQIQEEVSNKLKLARLCAENLKKADRAFQAENFTLAIEHYQQVLKNNPKDANAQAKLEKSIKAKKETSLRKASADDLRDIRNGKYGNNPERRQNLKNAGIDPDDAQIPINIREVEPIDTNDPLNKTEKIPLSVSKESLTFFSKGGSSDRIQVNSGRATFKVSSVPEWLDVKSYTYSSYIVVTCKENPGPNWRAVSFIISNGDEEVRVRVDQSGNPKGTVSTPQSSKQMYSPKSKVSSENCFNCPKKNNTFGLTLGYVRKNFNNSPTTGYQFGVRIEPLFKYGFGLNTGLNITGYSTYWPSVLNGYEKVEEYIATIPFHLQYRLNFSKWFNVFAYGGAGLNLVTKSTNNDALYPVTIEYGIGFRVNQVQLNIGKSLYWGDFTDMNTFDDNKTEFQNLTISVSYMF